MTQQPAAGERDDYKRRMEISQEFWQLNHERAKASDAALAAAAEQLRAVMETNEKLQAENERLNEIIASYSRASILNRKQLSDQASEISLLNAEAEMWQQRAEIAEREVVRMVAAVAAGWLPNPKEADRE